MAKRSAPIALATTGALLVALAACSSQESPPAPVVEPAQCAPDTMQTRTAGKLTIATGEPAYPPWFIDNRPDNGEGFESAVAYAVAEKLGYAREDVVWTRVEFDDATAPGEKEFDFGINQFPIAEEHEQAVDFSSPYYLVRQAVIAPKSSKIAGTTGLADLRNARLGAQAGTTSLQAITDLIKPKTDPRVYDSDDDAKKALRNGQLDGLVVDLPTAFAITSPEVTDPEATDPEATDPEATDPEATDAEVADTEVVGQLPQVGLPETFGLVLNEDSPLTGCVSTAVNDLRTAGALVEFERKWLTEVGKAPDLA